MGFAERTQRPPRTLTDAEVKRILKVTGEDRRGFRDHMIISFALGCALRESEILALDVDDVAMVEKKHGLRPRRRVQLRVFKRAALDAKPSDHVVHLSDATYYKLAKYLRTQKRFRQTSMAGFGSAPLFISNRGTRLSARQLRTAWLRWQLRAGFDQHYPFHSLRHTAITRVRRDTGDIRVAARFARHANIATTVRYAHVSDQEVADAVRDLPS
jgi:integrase/recombinase XerC